MYQGAKSSKHKKLKKVLTFCFHHWKGSHIPWLTVGNDTEVDAINNKAAVPSYMCIQYF